MSLTSLGDTQVLIVDDDPFNRMLIRSLLHRSPQISFHEAEDGLEVLDILKKHTIDIILLDLHMPKMNGFETLRHIRKESKYDYMSILIMTTDDVDKDTLYDDGANGLIFKPFKLDELEREIYQNILHKRKEKKEHEEKKKKKNILQNIDEKDKSYSLEEIEEHQRNFFCRLLTLYTKARVKEKHRIQIISSVAKIFAKRLGYTGKEATNIYCASQLHTIGLLGYNKEIDMKQKFSSAEKIYYDQYILSGYQLFKGLPETNFIKISKNIILEYREAYNGTGIPKGLKGNEITEEAMIVAMAETFEALLSKRPYRRDYVYTRQEVYGIFFSEKGKRFPQRLVKVFLEHFKDFMKLRDRLIDMQNRR